MINIQLIPHDVKVIDLVVAGWTTKFRTLLESNIAVDAAAVIPSGEADREALIAICNTALATCAKIQAADFTGVEARLQRLGSDLSHTMHGKVHSISNYIQWFEVVFNDAFGKSEPTVTTTPVTALSATVSATA